MNHYYGCGKWRPTIIWLTKDPRIPMIMSFACNGSDKMEPITSAFLSRKKSFGSSLLQEEEASSSSIILSWSAFSEQQDESVSSVLQEEASSVAGIVMLLKVCRLDWLDLLSHGVMMQGDDGDVWIRFWKYCQSSLWVKRFWSCYRQPAKSTHYSIYGQGIIFHIAKISI